MGTAAAGMSYGVGSMARVWACVPLGLSVTLTCKATSSAGRRFLLLDTMDLFLHIKSTGDMYHACKYDFSE